MNESVDPSVAYSPALPGEGAVARSDSELVRAMRRGSRAATETLVARHWDRGYRIAYAILGDAAFAEDVTQEAMLSMLSNLGRFDARREFAPWFHRIVSNRALDGVRARERRSQIPRLVAPAAVGPPSDPGLIKALEALPEDQRVVVVLRHVAGYETNEIARMLGIRRGTVGSRLRRGLDRLRNEMEVEDDG
jgi:RNA polymerase sigma-70 factor, ECF subfamily